MGRSAAKKSKSEVEIGSETLTAWHLRRVVLREKLQEQAGHEWAWLWRTRLTVLDYLIQRYDDGLTRVFPISVVHLRRAANPSKNLSDPEATMPYDRVPISAGPEVSQRKRENIHDKLESLHRHNRKRHAEAEKVAHQMRELNREQDEQARRCVDYLRQLAVLPEPINLPENLKPEQALSQLDERECKPIRQTITLDLGLIEYQEDELDEEMIRKILKEHGIDQDEPG